MELKGPPGLVTLPLICLFAKYSMDSVKNMKEDEEECRGIIAIESLQTKLISLAIKKVAILGQVLWVTDCLCE